MGNDALKEKRRELSENMVQEQEKNKTTINTSQLCASVNLSSYILPPDKYNVMTEELCWIV